MSSLPPPFSHLPTHIDSYMDIEPQLRLIYPHTFPCVAHTHIHPCVRAPNRIPARSMEVRA